MLIPILIINTKEQKIIIFETIKVERKYFIIEHMNKYKLEIIKIMLPGSTESKSSDIVVLPFNSFFVNGV